MVTLCQLNETLNIIYIFLFQSKKIYIYELSGMHPAANQNQCHFYGGGPVTLHWLQAPWVLETKVMSLLLF